MVPVAQGKGKSLEGEDALGLTLISVAVGAILAVAYQLFSIRLQRWVSRRKFSFAEIVTILGMALRLVVFVGILVIIGLWTPLNVLAVCLGFLVVFSVLTAVWLHAMAKRRGSPPSAGASSVLF